MHPRNCQLLAILLALPALTLAQPSRIRRPVNNQDRIPMSGHLSPKARLQDDQGRIAPSAQLPYVTLALSQTDAQKEDLARLLAEQQTEGSPNYHRWLTPDQYADRFGIAQADLNQVVAWAQGQGLTIVSVAKSRTWVAVSGSAAQVENAFQTELHNYLVDGELHFANTTEPSIPAALAPVLRAVHGLNDFRMTPAKREGPVLGSKALSPNYTSASGSHTLAPDDFATIYNIKPLYDGGLDGSGQKLVVVGQTNIDLSDLQTFRSAFGLAAKDPNVMLVPGSRDPGIRRNDQGEANLDLEWSAAIARNATILYVYSNNVTDAVQYAIDENLAPVISMSYGSCELTSSQSDALLLQAWAKQANAQGMTWLNASGDAGAADCNTSRNPGLSVDLPGSIPEVTSVGGTTFSDRDQVYWSPSNGSGGGSALSYIPEVAWNDSIGTDPSATGGGASIFFPKPSWQTASGVPADNARHVPDVSMTASPQHIGYRVYNAGVWQAFGGTSAPTPALAGIVALLNQQMVAAGAPAGVGNINPKLYTLAQTAPDIFHDVTLGDNIVTVACRGLQCTPTAVGFAASVGYDQATGLGSLDAFKLINAWTGQSASTPPQTPSTTISLLTNLASVASNDVVFVVATVANANGTTPSGIVSFSSGSTPLGSAPLVGSGGSATATLAVRGTQLPIGSGTITAQLDSGTSASLMINVSSSSRAVSAAPAIASSLNGASFQTGLAPGAVVSVFGSNLASSTQQAASVPLPNSMAGVAVTVNGIAAPLYYVSPGQLNIEMPYEVQANTSVVIAVNNGGQVATQTITVAASAPGIFTSGNGALVPASAASRGQTISLYLTGVGHVSPDVSTGAAPVSGTSVANLPKLTQAVFVTVAGVQATIDFAGIPTGLAGVAQINFRIPTGISTGAQPVVVNVGGVASAPASLTITN